MTPAARKFPFKAPPRLIRYFILSSFLFFAAYVLQWGGHFNFFFMGPPLYLAHAVKDLVTAKLGIRNISPVVRDYLFLLPAVTIYYGALGFFLKQLFQERSKLGLLSFVCLIVFLIYVHYKAWANLAGYYEPFPYP